MAGRNLEKRQVILDAAVIRFSRRGYHRTRVADIAGEAGVALGTVYIYFKSKEDILISLFQSMMSQFVNELRTELKELSGAKEKLAAIIDYHLKVLGSRPEQAMVTQIELRQIDPAINRGISGPLLSYFTLIEEVIAEGKVEGLYRKDLDTRMARKIVFGAIDEVVTCWVMSSRRYELAPLGKSLYQLLVNGLH